MKTLLFLGFMCLFMSCHKYPDTVEQALKQAGDIAGLRKLPKDSNPNRLNRRDEIDGRPRGVMRKFGMSRIKFRELAHQGLIPGVQKASW